MAASTYNFFARRKSNTTRTPSPSISESLFPAPMRFPPSVLSPHALPGTSPEAERALLEILQHNHQSYHIFFNDKQHDK